MAQLKAPTGGSGLQITEIPPPGQYVAVCLRVNDLFDVERQKYQSQEMELRDVTRFVFGVKDQTGKMYLIQTYEFTISGAPGSNLVKFLTAWLGQNPQMGWDYAEMRGRGAMITVQHKPGTKNPGQIYANISGISPVFQQLQHLVPNAAEFEAMVVALEKADRNQQPASAPAPRPPGAGYPTPAQPPQQTPAPGYGYPPPPAFTPPGQPGLPSPMPSAATGNHFAGPLQGQMGFQQPPPTTAPAPVAPPPSTAPARQFSPDGQWELVNGQWVPVQRPTSQPAQQQAPGSFAPQTETNVDEDVPF